MTHDNVTDIVERLREEANVNLDNGFGDMVPACNDVLAVLDDLATLRKQLENAREALEYMLRVFDETNANDYDDVHLMVRQSSKIRSIADCRKIVAAIKGDKS